MNIVEQAARIIRPEAFDNLWEPHTDLDEKRQAYQRSEAMAKAANILELALRTPDLAKQLCENEIEGWRWLGVPIDEPLLRAEVEKKYVAAEGRKG